MVDRFGRFAPLVSGILFVVLVVSGSAVVGHTPSTTASGSAVLAFNRTHHTRLGNGGFLIMLSVVAGLFFYGIVWSYLSRSARSAWLALIGFGGAVIFGVGGVVGAGVDIAFFDVQNKMSADTAQVLNILQNDLNGMAIQAGLTALMLAFGIAMVRGRLLPRWLAWTTIVIGVLAALGPLVFVAFVLEGVWVLVMSVMLFRLEVTTAPIDRNSVTTSEAVA